jgi:hypothetical protein
LALVRRSGRSITANKAPTNHQAHGSELAGVEGRRDDGERDAEDEQKK